MYKTLECEICKTPILNPRKSKSLKYGKNKVFFCEKCSLMVLPTEKVESSISKLDFVKDPIDEIFKELFKK
jgi:hypothetical protein